MTNTNLLEGIRCPNCGDEDSFRIAAAAVFIIEDDGIHDYGDVEWDDDSHIECNACLKAGKVSKFRASSS